jgi:RimJ/RimL family protein N-acetyltransferase
VIEVRRADPSDAVEVVALMQAVSAEPEGWLLGTDGAHGVAEERRYLRAARRHPDAAVFVATDGPLVVGRLSLARDPHPASPHVADLGLMVSASYRRRGIGRLLLAEATAWAREVGVTKLELHVFPWNEPAIALYEEVGFRREGYRQRHYRREGREIDALLMALDVVPDEPR